MYYSWNQETIKIIDNFVLKSILEPIYTKFNVKVKLFLFQWKKLFK